MTIIPVVLTKNVTLTNLQKEVIIGNMLGDGYIGRTSEKSNPYLAIEQTYPKNNKYVEHQYAIYQSLTKSPPKVVVRKPDRRTNKIYSSIKFRTLSLPALVPIYEMFYHKTVDNKYRKSIPINIKDYLTARSLAF